MCESFSVRGVVGLALFRPHLSPPLLGEETDLGRVDHVVQP